MKKIFTVLCAAVFVLALSTGALAGPYVGVQVGASMPVANNTSSNVAGISNPGFQSNVAAGVQVGYDWLGNKTYPNLKYFSVAVDYMYNGLFVNNALTRTTGAQNTLALIGAAKYPMYISKEYPNGRVFPYVGVGPTLNFTSLNSANATNIGFLVEPGLKFYVTKKISTDVAYRFNFTQVNLNDGNNTKFDNSNNIALVRVNYNF